MVFKRKLFNRSRRSFKLSKRLTFRIFCFTVRAAARWKVQKIPRTYFCSVASIIDLKSQIITVLVFSEPQNGSKSAYSVFLETLNSLLRLFVSRNPNFRSVALILTSWENIICGALEMPDDFMNQENRSLLFKFEWLSWPSTAEYAISSLSVFLWIPWNSLEDIERHHVPARRCASVLGSSKLRRVNLSYGFPARLLVFLVNLQSKRLKSTLISRLKGGESDLCLHHLLLIIGPGKSNQEVVFLDKTGNYTQFWSLKTRIGRKASSGKRLDPKFGKFVKFWFIQLV